jgi:hypothetical protein
LKRVDVMRQTLQILAPSVALISVGLWLALGANRGWTKTRVPIKTVEEVTGIESVSYEQRFVPGVEFLGAALFLALLLGGCSLLVRRPKNDRPINP